MTILNQHINNAIKLHKELHGETITREYVAAKLFPGSNSSDSQYESLRTLNYGGKIRDPQAKMLEQIFPDTAPKVWNDIDAQKYYRDLFLKKYWVDHINSDIALLWEKLNEGLLDRGLINKYLL